MILSVRHNYIYIRTKKTGSTTIEGLLTQNLGPDDIVLKRDFEVLKPLMKPGTKVPERERGNTPLSPTHVAIDKIRPLLRDDFWNGAFVFTSERHPYEKAVSFAYWRWWNISSRQEKRERPKKDFAKHFDEMVRRGKYPSFPLYSIDDRPVVHDFIRLESLKEDLARIADRVGITVPEELPRTREESRADRRPAKEILSDEQKQIVWERCRREFEILGYER